MEIFDNAYLGSNFFARLFIGNGCYFLFGILNSGNIQFLLLLLLLILQDNIKGDIFFGYSIIFIIEAGNKLRSIAKCCCGYCCTIMIHCILGTEILCYNIIQSDRVYMGYTQKWIGIDIVGTHTAVQIAQATFGTTIPMVLALIN